MTWLIRPIVTPKDTVKDYLVNSQLEPRFLSLTVRKLSQLSRIQRDVVLALAQRIREASKRDTLTIILPRFKYLRNIANSLISILQIRHEAGTKEIKEIIGKTLIPIEQLELLALEEPDNSMFGFELNKENNDNEYYDLNITED